MTKKLRRWIPFGASAIISEEPFGKEQGHGYVDPQFLKKAEDLGRRVAEIAVRLKAPK